MLPCWPLFCLLAARLRKLRLLPLRLRLLPRPLMLLLQLPLRLLTLLLRLPLRPLMLLPRLPLRLLRPLMLLLRLPPTQPRSNLLAATKTGLRPRFFIVLRFLRQASPIKSEIRARHSNPLVGTPQRRCDRCNRQFRTIVALAQMCRHQALQAGTINSPE